MALKSAWSYIVRVFIIHRAGVSLLGLALTLLLPVLGADLVKTYLGTDFPKIYQLPPEVTPPTNGIGLYLLTPWLRWDAEHYLTIAALGYSFNPALISFPPLYSLLVAGIGRLLFGQYLLAGLIVSNACYLTTLYYLFRLTERRWGTEAAKQTCVWFVFFPTSFFLLMPYTESLFLTLTLAAFYYCEDEKWWLGCGLGLLAGLSRLQGAILILPMLVLFWQRYYGKENNIAATEVPSNHHPTSSDSASPVITNPPHPLPDPRPPTSVTHYLTPALRHLIPILLLPLGFVAYQAYVLFFPPDARSGLTSNLSNYFNVRVVFPLESLFWAIVRPFQVIFKGEAYLDIWNFADIAGLLLVVWAMLVGRKLLPLHYQIYAWATLILLLTRTGINDNLALVSMLRYLLTLFPAFMVVGVGLTQNRFPRIKHFRRLILTLALLYQSLLIGFYIVWVWAG